MRVSSGGNLIVDNLTRGVRALRFVRPDLLHYLDEGADTVTSPLFQEVEEAALSDLPKGWTLIVNLGLVDAVNAAFYRCLLDIRKALKSRQCRLVLCGLTSWHQEVFELFRGPEVFTIARTEADALGWLCQRSREKLTPDGKILVVTAF
jgi:anti-anti-sigma regulatory factor